MKLRETRTITSSLVVILTFLVVGSLYTRRKLSHGASKRLVPESGAAAQSESFDYHFADLFVLNFFASFFSRECALAPTVEVRAENLGGQL